MTKTAYLRHVMTFAHNLYHGVNRTLTFSQCLKEGHRIIKLKIESERVSAFSVELRQHSEGNSWAQTAMRMRIVSALCTIEKCNDRFNMPPVVKAYINSWTTR